MKLSYLLALCLCASLFKHSYAGGIYHTSTESPYISLPLGGTMPAIHVYDITFPFLARFADGTIAYITSVLLEPNETYQIDTVLCPGCNNLVNGCQQQSVNDTCINDPNINYFSLQSDPGYYYFIMVIPAQQTWSYTVLHRKLIDGAWIPSILFFRMHNVVPESSSSTGPAVEWPMGRVTGLYIEDGVSSAFLPHQGYQGGWEWTEYDRDLTNYTFEVGFVTHLMTYDAFWIEPTFDDATYVSTTLNTTTVSGNWLGNSRNPITDEYTNYRYHFHIPIGGVCEVRLHYIYQLPGESSINDMLFVVRIENAYGLQQDSLSHRAMSSRQPEAQLSLHPPQQSFESPVPEHLPESLKKAIKEVKEKALTLYMEKNHAVFEQSFSAVNGASAAAMNVLVIALCSLVASFML